MTEWVRGFVIPQIAEVQIAFLDLVDEATAAESTLRNTPFAGRARAYVAQLRRLFSEFNSDLREAAEVAAEQATVGIQTRLAATLVRGDTRTAPHLRNLIYCAPLADAPVETGWVGIGRVSTLELAVNPNTPGYYSYWRAIEYGTGQGEVRSQRGRVLFGSFAKGSGEDLTRPLAAYRGGAGLHPIFLPRSGARAGPARAQLQKSLAADDGSSIGWGTIDVEIQPHRFIELGATGAALAWRSRVMTVQDELVASLARIGAP